MFKDECIDKIKNLYTRELLNLKTNWKEKYVVYPFLPSQEMEQFMYEPSFLLSFKVVISTKFFSTTWMRPSCHVTRDSLKSILDPRELQA